VARGTWAFWPPAVQQAAGPGRSQLDHGWQGALAHWRLILSIASPGHPPAHLLPLQALVWCVS
jgi:hypothetical protein